MVRSGAQMIKLPATSEESRKPQKFQKTRVNKMTNTPGSPSQVVMEQSRVQPKRRPSKCEKPDLSESDSESDSSSGSDSDSSDEEYRLSRRRRSRRRSKRGSKSPGKSAMQVIRVPTKELAQIALKMAFDRGQFNIKVIVE